MIVTIPAAEDGEVAAAGAFAAAAVASALVDAGVHQKALGVGLQM